MHQGYVDVLKMTYVLQQDLRCHQIISFYVGKHTYSLQMYYGMWQ